MDDRTIRIEAAICVFKLSVEHLNTLMQCKDTRMDNWIESCKKAYHAMLNARNELYDAIGGMEDYKYQINEGEKDE